MNDLEVNHYRNKWGISRDAVEDILHAGSVALNAARNNELHAAQEADELRALVLRQLQWQKHRDSVGIVMSGAEYAWIADAEAALASCLLYTSDAADEAYDV